MTFPGKRNVSLWTWKYTDIILNRGEADMKEKKLKKKAVSFSVEWNQTLDECEKKKMKIPWLNMWLGNTKLPNCHDWLSYDKKSWS